MIDKRADNNKTIKLTVIVPIYNSENYLEKCLYSLVNQKEQRNNYEIILVNDGSTDKSLEICHQFKKEFNNIHIIDIENSGPATAKNVGFNIAKGEYISFIDSDDEVMPNMFLKMLDNGYKNDSDIVCCSYIEINENGEQFHEKCTKKEYILDREQATKCLLEKNMIYSQCWTKIYKRKLLQENNIRFIDGLKTEEDFIFNLYAFLKSKTVTIIDEPLYIYRYHNRSLSRKYHKENIQQFLYNMSFRLTLTEEEIIKNIPELHDTCIKHCMQYYNLMIGRAALFPYKDVKQYFIPAHRYIKTNSSILIRDHFNIGMSYFGAIICLTITHYLYHVYRKVIILLT